MRHLRRALFGFCVAAVLSAPAGAQSIAAAETLEQLDGEAAKLGEAIAQKLLTLGTGVRIRAGAFYCEGNDTGLGTYLSNQLAAILANRGAGGYTVAIGPDASAVGENSYALGGEILRLGAAIRVYARLIRSRDSSLAAVWNADFAPTPFLEELVAFASSSSGNRVRRDSYEPDSVDAPVPAAAGVWISRTIHQNDGDWFRVVAETAGLLILETADSSFDPVMELYDESGRTGLNNDDDGGDGYNPRIQAEANAGQVFIVKVLGYDSSETGEYRFRATFETATEDVTEPNDTIAEATPLAPGSGSMNGLLRSRNDVDIYRLDIPEPGGRLTVYTEGRVDTLLSLYDSAGELIDEDDDSGTGNNARISLDVDAGEVYLEVRGYDGERGGYMLHWDLLRTSADNARHGIPGGA